MDILSFSFVLVLVSEPFTGILFIPFIVYYFNAISTQLLVILILTFLAASFIYLEETRVHFESTAQNERKKQTKINEPVLPI